MKHKKAQSSIEFTIIVGAMTFIMLGAFLVIQGRALSIHKEYMNTAVDQLGNIMRTEVMLASKAEGSYSREFTLPYTVSGYNYSILISGMNELSIMMGDSEYIVFTNDNISGNISKGRNIIRRVGENITINSLEEGFSLCSGGAGTDDDRCGAIDCSGWYKASGNDCYSSEDIDSLRCEGFQDCKDSNTIDCSLQATDALVYSCVGECKYLGAGACTGTTKGACSNNASGTPCSAGTCDGAGICLGTSIFYIKSDASVNLFRLDESGNIVLNGSCTVGTCAPSNPLDAFVLKDSLGDVVAYVDSSGNLCVENGDCVKDTDCSAAGSTSLVFKNSAGSNVAYISESGGLCFVGDITQNGNP